MADILDSYRTEYFAFVRETTLSKTDLNCFPPLKGQKRGGGECRGIIETRSHITRVKFDHSFFIDVSGIKIPEKG